MAEDKAHIGALAVSLHIPASQSLKEKRRVLKSIKDRVHARFNVSISEIGELDKWQAASLGVAMISNDRDVISGNFEQILALLDGVGEIQVLAVQTEYL